MTSDARTGVTLTRPGTLDEDLDLEHDGSVRFVENVLRDGPERPHRCARRLRPAADRRRRHDDPEQRDPTPATTSTSTATTRTATPHFGTTMNLLGTITPNCVKSRHRLRSVLRERRPHVRHEHLGPHRRRHLLLRQRDRQSRGGTTVDSPGYLLLGGEDARLRQPERLLDGRADGEDRFVVYYLQTMNVAAGHTLTARRPGRDRQLLRLHDRQPRLAAQLRRQRPRHGRPRPTASTSSRSSAPTRRTTAAPTPGTKYEADDIFLLRSATVHPERGRRTAPCTHERERRPSGLRRAARRQQRQRRRTTCRPAPAATTSTATATTSSATSRARLGGRTVAPSSGSTTTPR